MRHLKNIIGLTLVFGLMLILAVLVIAVGLAPTYLAWHYGEPQYLLWLFLSLPFALAVAVEIKDTLKGW